MEILRRLQRRAVPGDAAPPARTTGFPRSLDEALAQFPPLRVPARMRDPATDEGLRRYADKLVSLDWSPWQTIHLRAEIRTDARKSLLPAIVAALGEPEATVAVQIANRAGTAVNSLVIAYFTASAHAAYPADLKLAKTWLNLIDNHWGNAHTGTVVDGAWGVLFRSLWGPAARQTCWEPFAWDVPFELFGLEPGVITPSADMSS